MASGDSLVLLTPAMAEFPASNYPTFTTRNTLLVLEFDDTTDETCYFRCVMPAHYDGGGLTVSVRWMSASQNTGSVSIDVALASISDDADDVDGSLYAAANNINPTTASASGEVDYASVTFTDGADMDSIAAGETFFLSFTRDADGTTSTDNMSGDLQLVSIHITETV